MQVFLGEVCARHPQDKIVMLLDGAGWHASKSLDPPANMRLLPLPPCAPECNSVEHRWDELREKFFHNKVFDSLDALEDQLKLALKVCGDDHVTIKSSVATGFVDNCFF